MPPEVPSTRCLRNELHARAPPAGPAGGPCAWRKPTATCTTHSPALLDAMQHWGMLDEPPRHQNPHARTDAALESVGHTLARSHPMSDRPAAAPPAAAISKSASHAKLRFGHRHQLV